MPSVNVQDQIEGSEGGSQQYPSGKLGISLKCIARMILNGNDARIYTTSLDGFDTHANQARIQSPLLGELSHAISAFQAELEAGNQDKRVLTLICSEFGRRPGVNDGYGTDHGTTQPMLVVGSLVDGGIYGEHPSLTALDDMDLRFSIDFRVIYATILERWLAADSVEVLGRNFGSIAFI